MYFPRPPTFQEAVSELCSLLRDCSGSVPGRLTLHSLKTTSLSWAAKAGMDLESHRLLGYHFHPHLMVYSRDALADPLRHLDRLLSDVSDGRCKPDTS
eukprot:882624-Amphidinium_carterae.2